MSNKIIFFCSVLSVSIFCVPLISMTYAGTQLGEKGDCDPLDLGYAPGELLVRFAPRLDGKQRTVTERNEVLALIRGGTVKHSYKLVPGLTLVKLPANTTVENALGVFRNANEILYAEPNYEIELAKEPDDTRFDDLWGMNNTGQTGGTEDADLILRVVRNIAFFRESPLKSTQKHIF